MEVYKSLQSQVLDLDVKDFPEVALKVFNYQALYNPVYSNYLKNLGINHQDVQELDQVPFLPIELFKVHKVVSGNWLQQTVFTSSGTGEGGTSKHYMADLNFYLRASQQIFESCYGPLSNFNLLALLPNYLERSGSSLVAMVDHFIKTTGSPYSGFYLHDYKSLSEALLLTKGDKGRRTLLWGVSFALLDLAEQFPQEHPRLVIMETGGMKGQREEITREALHHRICEAFAVREVHSEYGMAELTSQAYASKFGEFKPPSWMQVRIRDLDDPLNFLGPEKVGGINLIDLGNIHSCAFIETQDLGSLHKDYFTVLGRMDNSDLRGCNLLVE